MTFIMNTKIQLVRIQNIPNGDPVMDYAFQFTDFTTQQATDYYRRKDPVFLNEDPNDSTHFYWVGYYQGKGAVMKFQKRNANLRWWVSYPQMTRINSMAMVPATNTMLACGYFWADEETTSMNEDTSLYTT